MTLICVLVRRLKYRRRPWKDFHTTHTVDRYLVWDVDLPILHLHYYISIHGIASFPSQLSRMSLETEICKYVLYP